MGVKNLQQRSNEDVEPHHSAGSPIMRQIGAFGITCELVVVVRYFGGRKLGVSGLVNAYRSAARIALEKATIIKREIQIYFEVHCTYVMIDKVIQIAKKNRWDIKAQKNTDFCEFLLAVRESDKDRLLQALGHFHGVTINEVHGNLENE